MTHELALRTCLESKVAVVEEAAQVLREIAVLAESNGRSPQLRDCFKRAMKVYSENVQAFWSAQQAASLSCES